MRLTELPLRRRIGFLAVLSILASGLVAAVGGYFVNKALVEQRMNSIRYIAESAGAIAARYHHLAETGALSEDEARARAKTAIGAIRYNGSEYMWVWTSGLINVVHANPRLVGKSGAAIRDRNGLYVIREVVRAAQAPVPEFVRYGWPRANTPDAPIYEKLGYSVYFKPWDWVIGTGVYVDDLDAAFTHMMMVFGLVVAGLASLALLLGWGVARSVSVPLIRLHDAMVRLGRNDLATEIPERRRRDEIGQMARALDVFKDNLARNARMEQEKSESAQRAAAEKRQAMFDLAQRFENRVVGIVDAVDGAAHDLQSSATRLSGAVEAVGAQCAAVAGASGEASANVETVAAASEEMTTSIRDLAGRIGRAAERSKAAARGADEAQTHLDSLAAAIEQVDQIVAAINAVAAQTNLLALNATIEAARAGEAGKGFAVVAGEVKNLANQTHAMTDQIGGQIGAVKAASDRAVEAMRAIIAQVGEIDHSTAEMAEAIAQQGAATAEISRNAQQAAAGTGAVSRNVEGIRAAEGETGAATHHVKGAADTLAGQAVQLKLAVDGVLAEIRAG